MPTNIKKLTLVMLLAILTISLACFGGNALNKYSGLFWLVKRPAMLFTFLKLPKYLAFCYENTDFCISFAKYLDKLPRSSDDELELVRHINRYPSFVDIFIKNPTVAASCHSNWSECMECVKYLNQNDAKAKELYSASNQQEKLVQIYNEALGDMGLRY